MTDSEAPRRLRRLLALTLATLWAEALLPALLPAAAVVAAFCAAALLGLTDPLPRLARLALALLTMALCAYLLRRGLDHLAKPTRAAAERRLERHSGLRHRPLDVLRDTPATHDQATLGIWRLHRAQALAALHRLRPGAMRPVLAASDPYAIRAGLVLLLVAGVTIAGPDAAPRLGRALWPGLPFGPATKPVLQAWIEPPGYTGLAPIFLSPGGGGTVTVPAGSALTVSLTGGGLRPRLAIAGSHPRFTSLGAGSWQARALLTQSGRLRVSRLFGQFAGWDVTVLPNEPPRPVWSAAPGQPTKSLATRLPWSVTQRWGVASLAAELRPAGRPDLPTLTLPIPLPGTPKTAQGTATPDLLANPYAGVKMTGRLLARDVSGQRGAGEPADFTLPARDFHNPLARAIADLRRRLALHPDDRETAANDLASLADAHDAYGNKSGLYLNLVGVAAELRDAPDRAGFDEAEQRLWIVALALDGALPEASAHAVAEARDALHRALAERRNGQGSDKEVAKRLEALREAIDKRLADLAEAAARQGAVQPFDPSAHHLTKDALDKMMQQMQQDAAAGHLDDAEQRMARLEKLLDKLENAKPQTREQAARQAEQSRENRQTLGAVQDLAKRETTLLDHAQTRAPTPTPGLPPQLHMFDDGAEPTPPPPDPAVTEAQGRDARTQTALRRALAALRQQFAADGGKPPAALDEADTAMADAAKALGALNDSAAVPAEQRAVAALQQGGQQMQRQMSRQDQISQQQGDPSQAGNNQGDDPDGQGEGQGQGESPGGDQRGRDPLGRATGHGALVGDDPSLKVPDQMEQGRSRAIQDELRRRGADRQRPQRELDYIDRLLKPF